MSISIAIVGSGPSGFYLAEALVKKLPDAALDIIDRLPTPFGLVRAGVAPDHQGTKNIVRQFERTLAKPKVRFLGNVEIGRDLSYAELKANYDVVVIAIGALVDRTLGIPGEDLDGVYGSGAFVGWYNGHPDFRALEPQFRGSGVAVIGNGNVALDIVRILGKTSAEQVNSDLCAHAEAVIAAAPLTDIWMLGRRGPVDASFTPPELGELGELARCVPLLDAAALPESIGEVDDKDRKTKEKNLEILKSFVGRDASERPVRLHIVFNAAPVAVLGEGGRVSGLRVERTRVVEGRAVPTGETLDLPVATVIPAIGYRSRPIAGLPFDERRGIVANEQGRVEPGVYTAGWCKRGPQGVIPANRADALAVAELIFADLAGIAGGRPGPAATDALLGGRGVRTVGFGDWQRINTAEVARGEGRKPREKFTHIEDMLALL